MTYLKKILYTLGIAAILIPAFALALPTQWDRYVIGGIRPLVTTDHVLVGGSATTTSANLEVLGNFFATYASSTGASFSYSSSTLGYFGRLFIPNLAVPAGSFLAIDPTGRVIATTTPTGSATPGGSNTNIQFNDSSSFGGQSSFSFDKTSNTVTLGAENSTSLIVAPDGTSANTNGGSLTSSAGAGNGAAGGGDATVVAGDAGATSGKGGDAKLYAGAAKGGTSNGGNLILRAGNSIGGGTNGKFIFQPKSATVVNGILDFDSLASSDKTFTFPNQSGTLCLTTTCSGSGSSYPFPLVNNGTSTLTTFYGGLNATTINATSTAATSTIANINTVLWIPTDFATNGCAGDKTKTDLGSCFNALATLAKNKGYGGADIWMPAIQPTSAQWTTPINPGLTNFIYSLSCVQGAILTYGGVGTSTVINMSNPTGHLVSDWSGCQYQGNPTLIAAGNNNTKMTGGIYLGGNQGAVGVNFHDNSVNGFGIDIAWGSNAYMLTIQNNSFSGGNGTTSNSHWGSLMNIDAASNSGEKNQIIGNNFTDPGNLVATSAINIQRGATASNMFTNNTYDNVGMFIGSSNGMVNINGAHIENAGCNYPGYIPFLGESSDQSTHIVLSGIEFANDCTGTFSWGTLIKHGGTLTVLGWHLDNYTGGTVNTFSDHSLDNGLESELICGGSVTGGTLTNIIGGNGNQPYSVGAAAGCMSTVSNSYPVGFVVDGSNTASLRNGGQNVMTFDASGNFTLGTAASNSIITVLNQLVVGGSNLGAITIASTATGCLQTNSANSKAFFGSCGSGTTPSIGGTLTSATAGSVLFAGSGTFAQDNANFFFDDTNNRLGIGTSTPYGALTVGVTPSQLVSIVPVVLLGTSTLSSPNANGTYFAINAPVNYGGDFLVFQKNGSQMLKIENNGKLTTAGDMSVEVGNFFSNNILSSSNGQGTIGTPTSYFSTLYVNKASTTLLSVSQTGLATTTISSATSTFAGNVQIPAGSQSVPSLTFTGGLGTGLSGDSSSLRFSIAGAQKGFFSLTSFQTNDLDIINPVTGSYEINNEVRDVTHPTYSFFADIDTGFSNFAAGTPIIVSDGVINSLYGNATTTFIGNVTFASTATGCLQSNSINSPVFFGSCSSSGTVGSGTTGQFPYYAGAGTTLTATSSLFLTASGKIGIGTTTPQAMLDIIGNQLKLSAGSYSSSAYNSASASYIISDKSQTASDSSLVLRDQGNARAEFGLVTDNDVHLKTVTGTYPSEVFTDRMLWRTNGNVDVVGLGLLRNFSATGAPTIIAGNSDGSSSGAGLEMLYDQTGTAATIRSIERGNQYRALNLEGSSFIFKAGTSAVTEAMRVIASKQVGIGTTTPPWLLTLASSSQPQLALSDGVAGDLQWTFRNAGSNLYISTTTVDGLSTTSPIFTITNAGNVGLGSSTPLAPLSIEGNLTSVQGIRMNNGPFISTGGNNFFIFGSGTYSGVSNVINNFNNNDGLLIKKTSTGSGNYMAVQKSDATALFNILSNGNTGVGSSTPFASFAVNPVAGAASNQFVVGSSTATNFKIDNSGFVFAPNTSSSGSSQTGYWCYDTAGQLIRDTAVCLVSARKFKTDIQPLDVGLADLEKIDFVSYLKKDPLSAEDSHRQMGVIADDVAAINPALNEMLVTYVGGGTKGEVHAFRYDQFTALLGQSIKDLSKKVDDIKVGAFKQDDTKVYALGIIFFLYVVYNEVDKRRKK